MRLTKAEALTGVIALGCATIARLYSLLLGYSVDDYVHFQDFHPSLALEDGRPAEVVLMWILKKFGAQPPFSGALGWAVLTLVLIFAGLYFCRLWKIDRIPTVSAVAVLLFVLHPYQTEIFTFHAVTLVTGFAIAAAVFSLAYSGSYGWKWYLSVVLLAFSLGIYQLVLNYIVLALIVAVPFYLDDEASERMRFLSGLKWRVVAIFCGCLMYEIVLRIVARMLHIPPIARSGFLHPNGALVRLHEAWQLAGTMFWKSGAILPRTTKWLLIASIVLFVIALLWERPRVPKVRLAAGFIGAIVIAIPACLGILLIVGQWWPASRMFAHAGILWAGIMSFSISRSGQWTRRALYFWRPL